MWRGLVLKIPPVGGVSDISFTSMQFFLPPVHKIFACVSVLGIPWDVPALNLLTISHSSYLVLPENWEQTSVALKPGMIILPSARFAGTINGENLQPNATNKAWYFTKTSSEIWFGQHIRPEQVEVSNCIDSFCGIWGDFCKWKGIVKSFGVGGGMGY